MKSVKNTIKGLTVSSRNGNGSCPLYSVVVFGVIIPENQEYMRYTRYAREHRIRTMENIPPQDVFLPFSLSLISNWKGAENKSNSLTFITIFS